MGVPIIVVICSACFGGLMSVATIIHQLLFSRNQSLNAAIQKRALEQQQQALAMIREEMREQRQPINTVLYEDSKKALAKIDKQIELLDNQKIQFLEKHFNTLQTHLDTSVVESETQASLELMKKDMTHQLKAWDSRLVALQAERSKLFENHFELSKSLQTTEATRIKQLNKLYDSHGKMLDNLQHLFANEQGSLAELFIKSSNVLIENTVIAPAKMIASFFGGGMSNKDLPEKKTKKESKERSETKSLQDTTNGIDTLSPQLTA